MDPYTYFLLRSQTQRLFEDSPGLVSVPDSSEPLKLLTQLTSFLTFIATEAVTREKMEDLLTTEKTLGLLLGGFAPEISFLKEARNIITTEELAQLLRKLLPILHQKVSKKTDQIHIMARASRPSQKPDSPHIKDDLGHYYPLPAQVLRNFDMNLVKLTQKEKKEWLVTLKQTSQDLFFNIRALLFNELHSEFRLLYQSVQKHYQDLMRSLTSFYFHRGMISFEKLKKLGFALESPSPKTIGIHCVNTKALVLCRMLKQIKNFKTVIIGSPQEQLAVLDEVFCCFDSSPFLSKDHFGKTLDILDLFFSTTLQHNSYINSQKKDWSDDSTLQTLFRELKTQCEKDKKMLFSDFVIDFLAKQTPIVMIGLEELIDISEGCLRFQNCQNALDGLLKIVSKFQAEKGQPTWIYSKLSYFLSANEPVNEKLILESLLHNEFVTLPIPFSSQTNTTQKSEFLASSSSSVFSYSPTPYNLSGNPSKSSIKEERAKEEIINKNCSEQKDVPMNPGQVYFFPWKKIQGVHASPSGQMELLLKDYSQPGVIRVFKERLDGLVETGFLSVLLSKSEFKELRKKDKVAEFVHESIKQDYPEDKVQKFLSACFCTEAILTSFKFHGRPGETAGSTKTSFLTSDPGKEERYSFKTKIKCQRNGQIHEIKKNYQMGLNEEMIDAGKLAGKVRLYSFVNREGEITMADKLDKHRSPLKIWLSVLETKVKNASKVKVLIESALKLRKKICQEFNCHVVELKEDRSPSLNSMSDELTEPSMNYARDKFQKLIPFWATEVNRKQQENSNADHPYLKNSLKEVGTIKDFGHIQENAHLSLNKPKIKPEDFKIQEIISPRLTTTMTGSSLALNGTLPQTSAMENPSPDVNKVNGLIEIIQKPRTPKKTYHTESTKAQDELEMIRKTTKQKREEPHWNNEDSNQKEKGNLPPVPPEKDKNAWNNVYEIKMDIETIEQSRKIVVSTMANEEDKEAEEVDPDSSLVLFGNLLVSLPCWIDPQVLMNVYKLIGISHPVVLTHFAFLQKCAKMDKETLKKTMELFRLTSPLRINSDFEICSFGSLESHSLGSEASKSSQSSQGTNQSSKPLKATQTPIEPFQEQKNSDEMMRTSKKNAFFDRFLSKRLMPSLQKGGHFAHYLFFVVHDANRLFFLVAPQEVSVIFFSEDFLLVFRFLFSRVFHNVPTRRKIAPSHSLFNEEFFTWHYESLFSYLSGATNQKKMNVITEHHFKAQFTETFGWRLQEHHGFWEQVLSTSPECFSVFSCARHPYILALLKSTLKQKGKASTKTKKKLQICRFAQLKWIKHSVFRQKLKVVFGIRYFWPFLKELGLPEKFNEELQFQIREKEEEKMILELSELVSPSVQLYLDEFNEQTDGPSVWKSLFMFVRGKCRTKRDKFDLLEKLSREIFNFYSIMKRLSEAKLSGSFHGKIWNGSIEDDDGPKEPENKEKTEMDLENEEERVNLAQNREPKATFEKIGSFPAIFFG